MTLHQTKIVLVFLPVFFFCVMTGFLHGKHHPQIKWKEISDSQFVVIFPAGYETSATYTLTLAGQMLPKLRDIVGPHIQIRGQIRIVLTDSVDDANGSATYFPYNQIEIFLFNPPPDSILGSYQEWIHLVLPHELVHILHANSVSGFTNFMRRLLGSHPALYPVMYSPVWATEGMAIYGESQLNRWGRLDTPDFPLMLNQIAAKNNIPNWADFWGEPTEWPGTTSNYLYGAFFINFLAKKYGPDKLAEFVRLFTRYPIPLRFKKGIIPIPLTMQNRFRQIFGQNIVPLWHEFVASLHPVETPSPPDTAQPVHFITYSGHFKKYPIPLNAKQVLYIEENYQEYPGIFRLDIDTGRNHRLVKRAAINGWSFCQSEQKLYFSANDHTQSFYYYSDLYTLDLKSQKTRRLTRGKRLFYPVKYGADKIYCVKRVKTQSFLCRLDTRTFSEEILSRGFDALAFPALSPAGNYIAASVKTPDLNWRIVLFDTAGHITRTLTDGETKCYYPQWKNDRELLFISEHNKSYRLTTVNLYENTRTIYNDSRVPAIKSFGLIPGENQHQVIGSFFAANGFNLAVADLSLFQAETLPLLAQEMPRPVPEPEPAPRPPVKSYRFLRELRPQYIGFSLRDAGNEFQPGFLLSGQDSILKNAYTVEGFYGFRSHTANWRVNYTYDGFYPTLGLTYSDLSSHIQSVENRAFMHHQKKLQFTALYPLSIKIRNQTYLFYELYAETLTDKIVGATQSSRLRLNGMKVGFFFNSAQQYYDAFAPGEGLKMALSYAREFKFMGSDYEINSAALEYKHYITLLRPNVLALRFTLSDSWGKAKRRVYMGGAYMPEGFHTVGDDMFNLMRAYPSSYFTGSGGWLGNIEYRISLKKVEKAFFIFRSIERFYGTLFADIGNLWGDRRIISPALSLGAELNMIAFIGDAKMNFTSGIAFGQHPSHAPVIYLRIGTAF